MLEDLSTWLQAMYHSGSISSFISAMIPLDRLRTGWIGQSLIQKGFSGKIEDKKNQEQLAIPLDRFVRLSTEWIEGTKPQLSVCLIGKRGQSNNRFVAIVMKESWLNAKESIAIAFSSTNFALGDTIHQLGHLVSKSGAKQKNVEPSLDYIEQLKSNTSGGVVNQLLSVKLPASNDKVDTFMKKINKKDLDSKSILAQYGNMDELSSRAYLISKWLIGLDLFQKDKDNIATLVFVLESRLFLCLWDWDQRTATFALIDSDDIEQVLMEYAFPLWLTSDDLRGTTIKTPSVTLQKEKGSILGASSSSTSDRSVKSLSVTQIDGQIEMLKQRVGLIENQLRELESNLVTSEKNDDTGLTILQKRLADTIDGLELLVVKLDTLEKRIDKVAKDRK